MNTVQAQARRIFLLNLASATAAAALPATSLAQIASPAERQFAPQPGNWRTFEVTTRVDIPKAQSATRVWLPVPSVNTDWQQSLESAYVTNGKARMTDDEKYGARILYVEFAEGETKPYVELTSRVKTHNRAVDWNKKQPGAEDPATLAYWTRPTQMLPTDGIVRKTALAAIKGATTDVEKAHRLYDWIVANTFREPKVQGCGEGDIKTMLETGNLGGKCADLNALFVGLCRSAGVPARDVYGLRLAPSAFGYRELGGNSANLKGAQHCRAEVFLQAHGWVAMDPADVLKVMRQETADWIKDPKHPLVAPVMKGLFGGWEGNWVAWNTAHDIRLPGSAAKGTLPFLMYPNGENASGRFDELTPDSFKYTISAREIV